MKPGSQPDNFYISKIRANSKKFFKFFIFSFTL